MPPDLVLSETLFSPDWAGADILKYETRYTWSAIAIETTFIHLDITCNRLSLVIKLPE